MSATAVWALLWMGHERKITNDRRISLETPALTQFLLWPGHNDLFRCWYSTGLWGCLLLVLAWLWYTHHVSYPHMFGVYVHVCGASGVWFLATCCWTTPPIFFAPTSRDATVEINGVSRPEIVFYFCLCKGIGGENGFPRVFIFIYKQAWAWLCSFDGWQDGLCVDFDGINGAHNASKSTRNYALRGCDQLLEECPMFHLSVQHVLELAAFKFDGGTPRVHCPPVDLPTSRHKG